VLAWVCIDCVLTVCACLCVYCLHVDYMACLCVAIACLCAYCHSHPRDEFRTLRAHHYPEDGSLAVFELLETRARGGVRAEVVGRCWRWLWHSVWLSVAQCGSVAVGLSDSLTQWLSGGVVVAQWRCCRGSVAQWLCGSVAVWLCGSVAVWLSGAVAVWLCGSVTVWLSGSVAVWLSGCVAQWLSGSVAVWLSGSVTVWLSGSVAQWLCGSVTVWLSVWPSGSVAVWLSGSSVAAL
jgi:FlaG/FlaF family flagellin (archaellin)